MDFAEFTAAVAMVFGAVAIAIGGLTRRRGGRSLLLLGLAFLVGPLSPLTKGHVPESTQILFSVSAIALSGAAGILAIADRRAH